LRCVSTGFQWMDQMKPTYPYLSPHPFSILGEKKVWVGKPPRSIYYDIPLLVLLFPFLLTPTLASYSFAHTTSP